MLHFRAIGLVALCLAAASSAATHAKMDFEH